MEYCSQSLKNIIDMKALVFSRQLDNAMDRMEYYITCHIFKELLECVDYLHTRKPPVIHRDLKPANILIAHNIRNNRFIKICDFGLITFHNRVQNNNLLTENKINDLTDYSQTHTWRVGTLKYMAPEVKVRRKYETKVDIYSLGVIAQELFDIDINE